MRPRLSLSAAWCVVNALGVATLCVNEADAKREAARANAKWACYGPHRAAQLIEGTPAAMHADALLAALQGLLQALPSATTHPAISAARSAVAKATSEQESVT